MVMYGDKYPFSGFFFFFFFFFIYSILYLSICISPFFFYFVSSYLFFLLPCPIYLSIFPFNSYLLIYFSFSSHVLSTYLFFLFPSISYLVIYFSISFHFVSILDYLSFHLVTILMIFFPFSFHFVSTYNFFPFFIHFVFTHPSTILIHLPFSSSLPQGHAMIITAVVGCGGERVASGGYDNTLKLWDLTTLKEIASCPLPGCPTAFAASEDGCIFATGTGGYVCKLKVS